ncbi:MAG: AzlC family ABC transporter permease [Acutalibacteraceae bacterium]
MKSQYFKGLYQGLPIALGYLSVSFGFGIMAMRAGLSVLASVGISFTNLTSAGQAAGVGVIAAGGSLAEMAVTQIIINLRYSLMGISLSQKLDKSFTLPKRLIAAHGITDEIFAVASSRKEPLTASYMYGLMTFPIIGWTAGTLLGALFGQLLPENVSNALGLMLYAMFIAVFVPAAKKEISVLISVVIACSLSIFFKFVIPSLSSGFAVIISAVLSAAICSLIFPIKEESEENKTEEKA